jgi:hypothetical protein
MMTEALVNVKTLRPKKLPPSRPVLLFFQANTIRPPSPPRFSIALGTSPQRFRPTFSQPFFDSPPIEPPKQSVSAS